MGDAIAGCTLIALANGAGDVVTAIVASGGEDGVAYNVGALFGAGLFVCTLTLTITIMKSPEQPIVVDKNTVYRDIPFFIVATLYIIWNGIYGTITWWSSAIMLAMYALLVIVVYFQGEPEEKILPEVNGTMTAAGENMLNKMKGALEVKFKAQMKFNDLKRMLIS